MTLLVPFVGLVTIAAFTFVLLVVVGPFFSWLTVSIPKAYDFRPTRDQDLSSAAKDFFRPAIRLLCDEGFEVVANLRPNTGITVTAIVVALVRRETGDMATVARATNILRRSDYMVAFDTQFADGTSVVTMNRSGAGIFPTAPYQRKLAIPSVRDVRTLYQIHRCRVQAYAPVGVPVDQPAPGAELNRLNRDHSRELEWLMAAGYFKPTTGPRHWATFKGAAVMTWRLIVPIKWLLIWHRRRRARAELRTLGFNAFTPVVTAAQA